MAREEEVVVEEEEKVASVQCVPDVWGPAPGWTTAGQPGQE